MGTLFTLGVRHKYRYSEGHANSIHTFGYGGGGNPSRTG